MFLLALSTLLHSAYAVDAAPKIINGEDASTEDYPMTGGMLMDATIVMGRQQYPFRMFVCSSTLIAPDVVMLAAHCVDDVSFTYGQGTLEDKQMVWSRQADFTRWDGTAYRNDWPDDAVPVKAFVQHEDFNLFTLSMGIGDNHDIALLFLEEPLLDVPLGVLPTAEEAAQIAEGNGVTVVGWGQQVATNGTQAPPSGTYAIKQWGESFISELGAPEFKVGEAESDVRKCHGDSGGPTFMVVDTESPEAERVIGVTSHAYDNSDCNRTGGVDTRVDAHLAWIDAQMRAACEDGTRVWCDEPGILEAPAPEVTDEDSTDGSGDDEGEEKSGLGCASAAASAPAAGASGWALAGLALAGAALARRARFSR